jgi:hypothetical protein
MICHDYKCIFIHVQRTGGTTIERWLQGEDQWNIKHNYKHITSSYAKNLAYPEYYNDYFKFAFVRDPYEHVLSQLIIAGSYKWRHLGFNKETPEESFLNINKDQYINIHCSGGSVINDYNESANFKQNSIYQNIFSEGVDKVYKFEDYNSAIDDIASILGIESPSAVLEKHGKRPDEWVHPISKLTSKDIEIINDLYGSDFEEYGYEKRSV